MDSFSGLRHRIVPAVKSVIVPALWMTLLLTCVFVAVYGPFLLSLRVIGDGPIGILVGFVGTAFAFSCVMMVASKIDKHKGWQILN